MKALRVETISGKPQLSLAELPDPTPGADEVVVSVKATALNHADLAQIRGSYAVPPGESDVPGLECAGVIESVGGSVRTWKAGDRVMALLGGGGQGTKVAIPAGQLMPLPASLSFEQGAALPEACLTAWTNLVEEGRLERGRWVLVTAAAGGMGTMAVQLASALGGRVIAAGRDLDRLQPLRALGAEALVTLGDGFAAACNEVTAGEGIDLVFDLVGGPVPGACLGALRSQGRIVLIGLMGGTKIELDLRQALYRRVRVIGSVLRPRPRDEKARLVRQFWSFAGELIASGRIRPVIDRTLPFERIAEAYGELAHGTAAGKIVLTMG